MLNMDGFPFHCDECVVSFRVIVSNTVNNPPVMNKKIILIQMSNFTNLFFCSKLFFSQIYKYKSEQQISKNIIPLCVCMVTHTIIHITCYMCICYDRENWVYSKEDELTLVCRFIFVLCFSFMFIRRLLLTHALFRRTDNQFSTNTSHAHIQVNKYTIHSHTICPTAFCMRSVLCWRQNI